MRSGLRHTADQLGGSREELKQARDQLSDKERLSLSDSLTGVWNRRYLDMALSDAMQRGRRMGHSFSILMVDIDRFKLVNDGFGHQVGDDILVELCRRIGGALRTHLDVVVRYGGEEFVVLLPETGPAGARVVAEKIRHIIRMDPFSSGDTRVNVTVIPSHTESFGLVAVESQACGTPVVAARVGGLRTAVADGASGVLVDGHDPADYAAAISRLVTDRALHARLSRGAVAQASRFGWAVTAAEVLDVYTDALTEYGAVRPIAVAQ